jgi:hypothetical protein
MRYPTEIQEELTKIKFGYETKDLSKNSRKAVVTKCTNCHKLVEKTFNNVNSQHQCSIFNGNEKKCFKCGEWKDLSLFNKAPKLSGGVSKMCRECRNNYECVKIYEKNRRLKRSNSFDDDINYYIKQRYYQTKSRCKKNKIEYNLDFEYLLNLWELQNGKCHYSNIIMKAEKTENKYQSWFTPSLDRKDPSMGYTKGNVVWCCNCINSFKNTMTDLEFIEMLKEIKWNFMVLCND